MPGFLHLSLASSNFVTRGKYRMACDSRHQIKAERAWAAKCGDGSECLNRLLCEGESDDCGRQIEALKNGRGEGSRPMEMFHEGSAINILIKGLPGPGESS